MARIFTEGFEMQDELFWTYVGVGDSLSSAHIRSGLVSWSANSLGQTPSMKQIAPLTELYLRFAYYTASNAQEIFAFGHTPTEKMCSINAIGSIGIGIVLFDAGGNPTEVARGTTPISLNEWHLVEIHIGVANVGGIVEVRIDGVLDVTFTGDTFTASSADIVYLMFGDNATEYFDDLALNDLAGGVDDSWCGDGRIILLRPNANGDLSQLTGSDANQVDNYLLVDDIPADGDTTYVEGATVDEKDLYNLSPSNLANVTIFRVYAEARAKDTVAAGGLISLVVKTHAVEYAGPDVELLSVYNKRIFGTEYLVNPQTGLAWTVAELDALQVGPKTRS
jgi:hypothetical protein